MGIQTDFEYGELKNLRDFFVVNQILIHMKKERGLWNNFPENSLCDAVFSSSLLKPKSSTEKI